MSTKLLIIGSTGLAGSYFFKKSHAIAYAHAIVVQMNLMKRNKYSFDAPSKKEK